MSLIELQSPAAYENCSSPYVSEADRKLIESAWREFVPQSTGDVTESFFALGGTKVFASKLIERLNEQFKEGFNLERFIQKPTLHELLNQRLYYQVEMFSYVYRSPLADYRIRVAGRRDPLKPVLIIILPLFSKLWGVRKLCGSIEHHYQMVTVCLDRIHRLETTVESLMGELQTIFFHLKVLDGEVVLVGYSSGCPFGLELLRCISKDRNCVKRFLILDYPSSRSLLVQSIMFLSDASTSWKNAILTRIDRLAGRGLGRYELPGALFKILAHYQPRPILDKNIECDLAVSRDFSSRKILSLKQQELGWEKLFSKVNLHSLNFGHNDFFDEETIPQWVKILEPEVKLPQKNGTARPIKKAA